MILSFKDIADKIFFYENSAAVSPLACALQFQLFQIFADAVFAYVKTSAKLFYGYRSFDVQLLDNRLMAFTSKHDIPPVFLFFLQQIIKNKKK